MHLAGAALFFIIHRARRLLSFRHGNEWPRGLGTGVHLAYDPCQLLTVEYKVVARADENQVCSFTRPTLGLRESYACGGDVRLAVVYNGYLLRNRNAHP